MPCGQLEVIRGRQRETEAIRVGGKEGKHCNKERTDSSPPVSFFFFPCFL